LVEVGEEAVSYCFDIARIETSTWQARKGSVGVEVHEESAPYGGHSTIELEASGWKVRQQAVLVEAVEEAFSYRPTDVARFKASAW